MDHKCNREKFNQIMNTEYEIDVDDNDIDAIINNDEDKLSANIKAIYIGNIIMRMLMIPMIMYMIC